MNSKYRYFARIVFLLALCVAPHLADASSASWSVDGSNPYSGNGNPINYFQASTDKDSYAQGETIRVYGSFYIDVPSTGYAGDAAGMYASFQGAQQTLFSYSHNVNAQNWISVGPATFTAPFGNPGNYTITVTGEGELILPQDVGGFVINQPAYASVSVSLPITVLPAAQGNLDVSGNIDFGEVNVGSSKQESFAVSNTGNGSLDGGVSYGPALKSLAKLPFVREALALGGAFSCVGGCSFNLGPSGSQATTIEFRPDQPVFYSRPATFSASNGQTETRTVSGTGVSNGGGGGGGNGGGGGDGGGSGGGGGSDPCLSAPRPSAWIDANPTFIDSGEYTTVSWGSSNADWCVINGGSVGTDGSEPVGPLFEGAGFDLYCENSCGYGASGFAEVSVGSGGGSGGGGSDTISGCTDPGAQNYNPSATVDDGSCTYAPQAPIDITFYADPDSISYGDSSTLHWSVENASFCSASGGWSGDAGTNGTENTGSLTSDTTFTITCGNGSGDQMTRSVTVNVAAANPTLSLSVSQDTIEYLESVTITWTSTNTTSCSSPDFSTGGQTSGSVTVGPISDSRLFSVTCQGVNGSVTSSQTRVRVRPTFLLDVDTSGGLNGALEATVVKGKPATSNSITINVTPHAGFSDQISFSLRSADPAVPGIEPIFLPATLTASSYATGTSFSVNVPGTIAEGPYTLTVRGVGSGVTRDIEVPLTVNVIEPQFQEF